MPGHHLAGLDRERSHGHCGRTVKKPRVRNGANRKDVRRLRKDDGCPNNDAQADCNYQCALEFSDSHVSPFFNLRDVADPFLIIPQPKVRRESCQTNSRKLLQSCRYETFKLNYFWFAAL